MAMAQNNKSIHDPMSSHTGVEVSEEILALGGGGPRVVRGQSRASSVNSHGSPYSNTDSSPSPPQMTAYGEVKQEPSIAQVMPPQCQQSLQQPPHSQSQEILPYYDATNFLNQGIFTDYNNVTPSMSPAFVQSPAQNMAQPSSQDFSYLPIEFNDVFGVNTSQTADVYGSDVLGQMGFEMPYQSMDHLQMSL